MKYIVAYHHSYYPEIILCETLEQARQKREEILENDHREDGHHQNSFVLIAELIPDTFTEMKTYY